MDSFKSKAKYTQGIGREQLQQVLAVARGDQEADLLIKNVKILDLVCGEILDSAIVISGKTIAGIGKEYEQWKAKKTFDAKGMFATPGFIDGHLHIESSMMTPFEFQKTTLPLGTTTAICDPHEITNVLGEDGFSWFLRSAPLMIQNLFVQVSSCVPAVEGLEDNGGEFTIDQMTKFKNHPHVLGMAEMMNFPGVITGDKSALDKIEAFEDMKLDGHSPLLRGMELNAYLASGIDSCHETVSAEEAKEKIQKGMDVIIREGTVAKNLDSLAPILNEFNSGHCFLCSDDRNPLEIDREGHINYMVKRLINEHNISTPIAYRVASLSAAKHYRLDRLGLIAPGYQADILLINDLKEVDIQEVMIQGKFVGELDLEEISKDGLKKSEPPMQNTMNRSPVVSDDFSYEFKKGHYNVIEIIPEEIITNKLVAEYSGCKFLDGDIVKLTVVERYGQGQKPIVGLVKGFKIEKGAIASSVAHDSHNIIAAGRTDAEIALAVNTLIKSGGGFCVVEGGKIKAHLELPIAGLISSESNSMIVDTQKKLQKAYLSLGGDLSEPFLQMAFLALPVIPSLKLTNRGLVDVNSFKFIPLRVEQS